MMQFHWITPRLAVGSSIDSPGDAAWLKLSGITHVINVRRDGSERPRLTEIGLHYLHLPQEDDGKPKPVSWFKDGIVWALEALKEPHHKIYVHCAAGHNRSPSMLYAIMRVLGIEPQVIIRTMKNQDHEIDIRYKADADKAAEEMGYHLR